MSQEHLRPYLAMEGLCRNPVFVLGSPRSGTTAMAEALGRHPDFWAGQEGKFIAHLLGGGSRADEVFAREQAFPQGWMVTEAVGREEWLGFLGLGINALFSSRSGGRRWIDHAPRHTRFADVVAAMFPGAQFVLILRHGCLAVHSMINLGRLGDAPGRLRGGDPMPAVASDFSLACEIWSTSVLAGLRLAETHPDRCLTLRNEDLARTPETEFASVFRFLGVEPHADTVSSFAGQRLNTSFPAGGRSANPWELWSEEQRATFASVCGGAMVSTGYTIESLPSTV